MNDLCIMLMELGHGGGLPIQSVRAMRDVMGFVCGFFIKGDKTWCYILDAACFMAEYITMFITVIMWQMSEIKDKCGEHLDYNQ